MSSPTLCFAVNRIHAQHIRDKFEEAGIRAGYVDCNVGVLTMGVDWDVR